MHELSIAMTILDAAEEEAERRGWSEGSVQAIHVRIGVLSGVVPEALQSAYTLASEQTPFRDTRLQIEDVPITIRCAACGRDQFVKSPQSMRCPECGAPASEIVSGHELEISAMEVAA